MCYRCTNNCAIYKPVDVPFCAGAIARESGTFFGIAQPTGRAKRYFCGKGIISALRCKISALFRLSICDFFQPVTLAIRRWEKDSISHEMGVHSRQLQNRNHIPFCACAAGITDSVPRRLSLPHFVTLSLSLSLSLSLRKNNWIVCMSTDCEASRHSTHQGAPLLIYT
jgi:hypothetical protein